MSNIIAFLVAHQTAFAAVAVAILDLLFALKPDWESNGILHWILVQAKAIMGGGSSQTPGA